MRQNSLLYAARVTTPVAASGVDAGCPCRAPIVRIKTLTYRSEGGSAGFGPAQYSAGIDFMVNTFAVYNRLVEFGRGDPQVEPGLAEKWDISANGEAYTFHPRHGLKFQTTSFFNLTREFDADDIVLTLQRTLGTNPPFRNAYPASYTYITDMGLDKLITSVEKVDPYMVKFMPKEVNAPFIQNMAMGHAPILSAEYVDQLLKAGKATDVNQHPVGTGLQPRLPHVQRDTQTSRQGRSASGARHGDQQEGDHRLDVPGCRPVGQESDAADRMVA